MRNRPPTSLRALALAGATAVAGGCDIVDQDSPVATFVHVGFELTPGPDTPEDETWHLGGDDVIRGVVVLEPLDGDHDDGGTPMAGVLALTGETASRVVDIDARFDRGIIEVAEGSLAVPDQEGTFFWTRFELQLDDASGDGVLDTGRGIVVGRVDSWFHAADITDGRVEAEPDLREPEVLLRSTGFSPNTPLPYDAISTRFTKPVPVDALSDGVVLLVDGEPAEAAVRASDHANMPNPEGSTLIPLTTTATVTPAEPIPLGAEVSVDVSGVADLSGLGLSLRELLEAPPDSGSALDNLDFAAGFEGWHRFGAIEKVDEFQGAEPSSGDEFVVLDGRSQLLAELALPDDTEALTFTATGFSEWPGLPEGVITADVLRHDGEVVATTTLGPVEEDDMIECGDCVLRYRTPPLPLELDLADAAGESVFLRVTIPTGWETTARFEGGSFLSPPPHFAAALEELSLQRAEAGE